MASEPMPLEKGVVLFPRGTRGLSRAQRREAQLFCLSIVRDETYRAGLMLAAQARDLPPAIEALIWHYAYGKPPDKLELSVGEEQARNLEDLSPAELADRARRLAEFILSPALQEAAARQELDRELQIEQRAEELEASGEPLPQRPRAPYTHRQNPLQSRQTLRRISAELPEEEPA